MRDYIGPERRSAHMTVCGLHGIIDGKLDRILQRQEDHIQDITRLQDTVENGLRSTVFETKACVESIERRVISLESGVTDFSWFRTWITELRDNLFKNVLKLSMAAAVIWFIFNFGKAGILKIFGG